MAIRPSCRASSEQGNRLPERPPRRCRVRSHRSLCRYSGSGRRARRLGGNGCGRAMRVTSSSGGIVTPVVNKIIPFRYHELEITGMLRGPIGALNQRSRSSCFRGNGSRRSNPRISRGSKLSFLPSKTAKNLYRCLNHNMIGAGYPLTPEKGLIGSFPR
jgi:hypothetical protein